MLSILGPSGCSYSVILRTIACSTSCLSLSHAHNRIKKTGEFSNMLITVKTLDKSDQRWRLELELAVLTRYECGFTGHSVSNAPKESQREGLAVRYFMVVGHEHKNRNTKHFKSNTLSAQISQEN
ncbi:hypothetical protein PoB_000458600 [Plakobranchus ocellatus]|uniref:Uncharacterized protein n=1 Tax=Plakobranchus ocellatus TaxID=259542 RepID=A0AAV3XRJ9_9GAST|nr:hypothetical protein PoB_000458600 [Plakobranchus ocellatus]